MQSKAYIGEFSIITFKALYPVHLTMSYVHVLFVSFPVAPILPVLIPLAIDPHFMVSSQDVPTVNVNSTTETEIRLYVPPNRATINVYMYI